MGGTGWHAGREASVVENVAKASLKTIAEEEIGGLPAKLSDSMH
jgi:hypothetical protein